MDQLAEMLGFLVLMAAAGAATGVVSGLLGVGGGLFAPAALYLAFDALGWNGEPGALLAAGTACALTMVMAVVAWQARGEGAATASGVVGALSQHGPLFLSGLAGAAAVSALGGKAVFALLGIIAAAAAVNRAIAAVGASVSQGAPTGLLGAPGVRVGLRLGAGAVSAATGVGGSTVLSPFAAQPGGDARAAALSGIVVGAAGAIGFMATPLLIDGPVLSAAPFTLGAVSWGAAFVAAPAAVLAAPVGGRLARLADRRVIGLVTAALAALIGLTFLREAGLG